MMKSRRSTALLTLIAMLQSLLLVGVAAPAAAATRIPPAPFADVYASKYQDAVGLLYMLKVASGTAPYTFSPDLKVTRAQMAAFLIRALGDQPAADPQQAFSDVPTTYWAAGSIARAVELGLLKGDPTGKFRPEDPVTFGEVATLQIRALGYESQVPAGTWPINYVLKANDLGLLAGADFSVTETASRGEVAILLTNMIFKVKSATTGQTINATVFKSAASIKILPDSSVISADHLPLTLQATDWFGNTFNVTGQWSVLSNNGNVDSSGMLYITGSGAVNVRATYGALSATQAYNRIKSVTISPASAVAPVGGTVQFSATGLTQDDQSVPVDVTWTASGPGSIDPKTGLLTVTGGGTITVSTSGAVAGGSATVTAVSTLTITPATTTVTTGQKVQFTAIGSTPAGASATVPVKWSVLTGGGSIDAQGQYTASGAGSAVVQATSGSVTATASVTVVGAIRIQPESPSLAVGTTTQFKAQVQTATGWQDVNATWTISNSNLGVLSDTGKFAVTGSGSGTLTATYGGLTAQTTVSVSGPAAALKLAATRTSLPANGSSTSTVTATFVDSQGNATTAPVGQVLFSLSSPTLGTLSGYSVAVINNQASVTFTSGSVAAIGTITVTAPGSALGAGILNISTNVPTANAIQLSAYPLALAADGNSKSTITATLVDQDGQPMTNNLGTNILVTLNATGNAGNLLSSVLTILPSQSTGTVQFVAATSPGASVITGVSNYTVTSTQVSTIIVGTPAKLKIRTPIADTVADGVKQASVTVEVQDANGNVVTGDNTDIVSLVVNGPAPISTGALTVTGGTAIFKLATTKSGTYSIAAQSVGSNTLTTAKGTLNFVAGTASALDLKLDPAVDAVSADGVTPVRLLAHVLDSKGNVVTSSNTAVTFQQLTANAFNDIGSVTVNAVSGVAVVSITPKTSPASDTFIATATGLNSSAPLTVTTRITGWANKLAVQTPSAISVVAGQTLTVSVWVEDASNHVLTNDSGRAIALVLNDSNATSNSPQTTTNGVATFTVTPGKSGTLTIKAQALGLLPDNVGSSVAVSAAPPDHVVLSASATSVAADGHSTITITPQVVDIYGNNSGAYVPISLSVSDTNIGRLNISQGTTGYGITFTPTSTPGMVTISGTSSYPVSPVTITTYIAGPPTHVVVDPPQAMTAGATGDSAMKVTVRVTDDNGHTVSGITSGTPFGTSGIVSIAYLTASNTTTGALTSTATYPLPPGVTTPNGTTTAGMYLINGQATFVFTDTKAETMTFTPTMSIGTTLLTPVSATGIVNPGSATSVLVTSTPTAVSADTTSTVTVTATMADAYGNAVPSTGDVFTFTMSTTQFMAATGTLSATATSSGATITLQSKSGSSGTTYVTATSGKTGLSSAPLAIVQDSTPPKAYIYVGGFSGGNIVYASDPSARLQLSFNSRTLPMTVTVYVNGVQVPIYTSAYGGSTIATAPAGTTTLTGYIMRSDFGGAGIKSVLVILSDSVGTGPVSDPYTFQVQ